MRTTRTAMGAMLLGLAMLLGVACSSTRDGDGQAEGGPGGPGSPPRDLTGLGGQAPSLGGVPGQGAAPGEQRIAPFMANSCDKVDIVFAVDGSFSMTEELDAMRRTVFPAFADRLRQVGAGVENFRVGVIDACPRPANLHIRGASSQCDFFGGHPWVESVSPNFDGEIECVGDIMQTDIMCNGDNDDEQPASAIAAALEQAGPGQANEGFLRGDALLIAIAITDEDEQPTQGGRRAEDVYRRLVDVAGGNPKRMVFLGIGGAQQCEGGVYGGAENARTLREITRRFDDEARGVFWDLCEGRLEDGLSDAFRVIEKACDELPPPVKPPSPPVELPPEDPCDMLDVDCGDYVPPPTQVPGWDGGGPE